MASLRSVWLLLMLFAGLMGSLKAYQFNVGGKDGWVQNPSESYSNWSSRMRFQVNDALFFKYMQGKDSVLVVSKDDYDTCNTQKPIMKLDGGDSVFKFDRSGPFYFISGNKGSCDKGQKLTTVVIALRNQPNSPPPPPSTTGAPAPGGQIPATPPHSPSPSASTPSHSTPAKNPAISPTPMGQTPGTSPNSPSPSTSNSSQSPTASSPATSPVTGGQTPGTSPNSPSQSPSASTPSLSPAASTPATSPTTAPVGQTPATSPYSPSPSVSTPSPSPAATTPATSPATLSPPGENGPNADDTPANTDASGLPDSSAPAFTPSIVFVSLVTIVLSLFMGSFVR